MTDHGYVGTDFALDDLTDRHTQEKTHVALVLAATTLARSSADAYTTAMSRLISVS
ncbi:hypothetical protein [Pseudomonas paraeruginosa]|uniref:hypothetical protein n=1 Tax=Pseudomonas paraeruginosa TaxID=2994495 RepID=UPI0039FDC58F